MSMTKQAQTAEPEDRFARRQKRLRAVTIVVAIVSAFAVVAPMAVPEIMSW